MPVIVDFEIVSPSLDVSQDERNHRISKLDPVNEDGLESLPPPSDNLGRVLYEQVRRSHVEWKCFDVEPGLRSALGPTDQ